MPHSQGVHSLALREEQHLTGDHASTFINDWFDWNMMLVLQGNRSNNSVWMVYRWSRAIAADKGY